MTFEELNARAIEIAEHASQLSSAAGDEYIRAHTRDFPDGIRLLIITMSSKNADERRHASTKINIATSIQRDDRKQSQKILTLSVQLGLAIFVIALILVFVFPDLRPAQWFTVRLLLIIGACLFSNLFSGALNVKGTIGRFAIAATAGFAVFVLTYFFNPPSLPPVESPKTQATAP